MRWPHFHKDPYWQKIGVYAYYTCRCGARRVRRINWWGYSPIQPGWPVPVDKHGQAKGDTGWIKDA